MVLRNKKKYCFTFSMLLMIETTDEGIIFLFLLPLRINIYFHSWFEHFSTLLQHGDTSFFWIKVIVFLHLSRKLKLKKNIWWRISFCTKFEENVNEKCCNFTWESRESVENEKKSCQNEKVYEIFSHSQWPKKNLENIKFLVFW